MCYEENIRKCQKLDELFQLWKNKEKREVRISTGKTISIDHKQDGFITDGIVNQEIWNDGEHKKILFVLKEAYGEGDEWALTSWLNECAGRYQKDQTWKYVAQWVYGIEKTSSVGIERYKYLNDEERDEAIRQIAVINIRKSNGESSSDYSVINGYAKFDKEELKKEFELIDADIVICGSTFGILCNTIYGKELEGKNDNWYYFWELGGRERLLIDYYHPAYRIPSLLKYYGIVNIYQQALLEQTNLKY